MHCALLRESLEAGKTFPIIVGWNKPGVEWVVLKAGYRLRCGQLDRKPQATCTQESYSFSQSCINFLFTTVTVEDDAKWKWACVEVPERGVEYESMRDQRKSAQYGHSLCVHCELLHTGPLPPPQPLKERSRRDRGGNGAREGLLLYIFTLRFSGRPAKASSWLESEQQKERVKEWKRWECSFESVGTSRTGLFSAEVVKMWLKLSCWSVDILKKNDLKGVSQTVGLL